MSRFGRERKQNDIDQQKLKQFAVRSREHSVPKHGQETLHVSAELKQLPCLTRPHQSGRRSAKRVLRQCAEAYKFAWRKNSRMQPKLQKILNSLLHLCYFIHLVFFHFIFQS